VVMSGLKKPATSAFASVLRGRIVLALLLCRIGASPIIDCDSAQAANPDALCRSVIFGDEVHSDVKRTRALSARMPPVERFDFLVSRVLPEYDEEAINLDVDFADSLPRALFDLLNSGGERLLANSADGVRVTRPGGQGWPSTSIIQQLKLRD
jgi:hypothetical protein